MALYDTRFGLPQTVVDYLNQGLPDISNLYTPPVLRINPIRPRPDDPEGIISLYTQFAASGDGGDGFSPYDIRQGDSSIRTPDQYNPYAYRQSAAKSGFGSSFMEKSGIGGLLGLITGNPILGLIDKGIGALANRAGPALNDFRSASTGAQFFQNLRDRRAREDAAARGAAKQAAAARVESFRNFDRGYGGGRDSGGTGSAGRGGASPGSTGPGGSDSMGSF